MKAQKKLAKKPTLPIQISLPELVPLGNGTMFVILRTLDELDQFWRDHQGQFEFACEGGGCWDDNDYLRHYEWVFGTSKSAVVKTVLRWDTLGVGCEFYRWSKSDLESHAFFRRDRDLDRDHQIGKGLWSDADEEDYQAYCLKYSPETYRGHWRLKNLPHDSSRSEWLPNSPEITDPEIPMEVAEKMLQEQTFDDWKVYAGEIQYHDRASIEATIADWRNEQASGEDYYGLENESTAPKALQATDQLK